MITGRVSFCLGYLNFIKRLWALFAMAEVSIVLSFPSFCVAFPASRFLDRQLISAMEIWTILLADQPKRK